MIFAPSHLPSPPKPGSYVADLALLVVGGSAFLIGLILWLDNAQGGLTGNGLFKSLELKEWVVDPANAPLYPSNYLFYPVYGALCQVLDLLGIFAGDPRRQITILNALSASLCLGCVYLLVRTLTGDRLLALLAALFHISCNYVLFLAIINEDIMSSYTVMFVSMALAGVWFAQPTAMRVAVVSAVFTIGWLFEWRLMFPTLPAMVAALWLCERRLVLRFAWIGLFLAVMFAVTCLVAWFWWGHDEAAGPLDLIWTGKAVNSAWGGFSWAKFGYLWEGVVGYLLGIGMIEVLGGPGWDTWRYTSSLWLLAVGIVSLVMLWRVRADSRAWSLLTVFGGTLLAGQVFNLYSQPQDPQMQINVMAWLTLGWALASVAAVRRWGSRGRMAMAALTVLLLAYNISGLVPFRGADTAWQKAIERFERETDPARTVFVLHDFDWLMTYASMHWGQTYPGLETLSSPPQETPRFKWIGFANDLLRHPGWSASDQADAMRREIDQALDLGYDVVAVRLWATSADDLKKLSSTIADGASVEALHRMLHTDFVADFLFDDPVAGAVHRLRRAPGR
ncbi:MAG: hypothetical protein NTV97_25550 [Alphaproteobacteria bacterium]|nr:hypothetical protein [Alphaproteobacteria bacterium]